MRWSMLPVSVAAHAAAFVACLILPLAADIDPPTPWPSSAARQFVPAAAVPAPVARPLRSSSVRTNAAPTSAPDRIEPEADVPSAEPGADGGIPDGPALTAGIPIGLSIDAPPPPPPPAPPDPPRPTTVRAGGTIREPRKLVDVAAVYPEIARLSRVEGTVILEATIDERGMVMGARVLRSHPLLDAAALAALKQWRYTPTLLNGVPVRVLMTVTFHFSLGDRTP